MAESPDIEQDDADQQNAETSQGKAPVVSIRDYPIEIAGWENQYTRQSDGQQFTKLNFVLTREYKKGDEKSLKR